MRQGGRPCAAQQPEGPEPRRRQPTETRLGQARPSKEKLAPRDADERLAAPPMAVMRRFLLSIRFTRPRRG